MSTYVVPFPCSLPGKGSSFGGEWKGKLLNAAKCPQCPAQLSGACKRQPLIIKAHMVSPSTFFSRISTDIPFDEAPEASFARYLENKPRVFEAMFPNKLGSLQLNEEEWTIHMIPIKFPFLTIWPVVDVRMRCKSNVLEYSSSVPRDISKVLEVEVIRLEIRGLRVLQEVQFSVGVKGAMYSDRRGLQSRLKGQMQFSISFIIPPMLAFIVSEDAVKLVLRGLAKDMEDTVYARVLKDYSEFKREILLD